MLRTTGDIGTDDTMISLPRHKPCIYRAYSLVEKININKTVTQIDVKMTTTLREEIPVCILEKGLDQSECSQVQKRLPQENFSRAETFILARLSVIDGRNSMCKVALVRERRTQNTSEKLNNVVNRKSRFTARSKGQTKQRLKMQVKEFSSIHWWARVNSHWLSVVDCAHSFPSLQTCQLPQIRVFYPHRSKPTDCETF